MAGLILPGMFTSQPQYPALVSQSFTSKLVGLCSWGGNQPIDSVVWTNTQRLSGSKLGLGANLVVGNNAVSRASGINLAAGADFTMLFCIGGIGYNGSNPGMWRDGSGSAGSTFCIFNAATGRPWIRVNGSDVLKPVSGYQIASGSSPVFAYRVRSAVDASFAVDGQVHHTATHSTATVATSVWNIGYQSTTAEVVSGSLAMLAVWARALSNQELQAVTANPWQVFQAPRRVFVGALAGGGTNYSQSVSGSFTLSGSYTSAYIANRSLNGSVISVGGLSRVTNKTFAGTTIPVGSIVKQTNKTTGGSIITTGSVLKNTARRLASSITPSGSLATLFATSRSVAGAFTMAATLATQLYHAVVGSIASRFYTLRRFLGRR